MLRCALQREDFGPFDVSCADIAPPNRVLYILEKWSGKGWWEYGVSLRCGWMTQDGKAAARSIVGPGVGVPQVATAPLDSVTPCRIVILRATYNGQSREYVESVPAHWDAETIRFCRNDSGWCAGNLYRDLRACGVDTDWLPPEDEDGPCLCRQVEIVYVREATAEEAARINP